MPPVTSIRIRGPTCWIVSIDDQGRRLNAFEWAGLDHSAWKLELSRGFNAIDFSTVSDVILTFEFFAFKSEIRRLPANLDTIRTAISQEMTSVSQLISAKSYFPQQWQAFTESLPGVDDTIYLEAPLSELAGLDVATLNPSQFTAFYVLENDGLDPVSLDPSGNFDGDVDGSNGGSITISKIWDHRPPLADGSSASVDRLRDILVYYQASLP